ncbi:MAG: PspC domain-containing protein [Oscillochloridaceae bacterium]|nr:PspC domain-containing protein [Chloroflexaceae bacterium]MDW8392216.1 PspC domain-containing protein [Oscillochloridaceae bacterium]
MYPSPRLERSRSDVMIAGVCGGLARYLNIDSTIVRLVFVLLAFSGPALLIYPLLWLVMPRERPANPGTPAMHPGQVFVATGETQRLRIDPMTGAPNEPEEIPISNLGSEPAASRVNGRGRLLGYILLGLGVYLILQMIWPGIGSLLFPALLIAGGIYLLRRAR